MEHVPWDRRNKGLSVRLDGKIVRFDQVRGYGFITPDDGGDDIFLHVNDLEFEKSRAKPGFRVSFEVEEGSRGQFASGVRLLTTSSAEQRRIDGDDRTATLDDYFDVLTPDEFVHVVTEMLLRVSPSLSGQQILEARSGFQELAGKHGWTEP